MNLAKSMTLSKLKLHNIRLLDRSNSRVFIVFLLSIASGLILSSGMRVARSQTLEHDRPKEPHILPEFSGDFYPGNLPTNANRPPIFPPLDLSALESGKASDSSIPITSSNISQSGLTIPSLWWAREQFGGKLLENWLAYPGENGGGGRVDLVVNRQIWSLRDYLERYQFVNHFGQSAKDYGYNTRVFNRQKRLLAAYTCDFTVEPIVCNLWMDSSGLQNQVKSLKN
ncbi:MAG: hypothetical protein D6680_04580 [Cyanobacteria bacterium J007]|jgi:hypothetical protein|nr:MAG: hypothetical protein D6680_04580 [Cyanobacteria bacterium J007]